MPAGATNLVGTASSFTAGDVAAILSERGWLEVNPTVHARSREVPLQAWLVEAAALLGPRAADRGALAELLSLIFGYDAPALLAAPDCHEVLAREGAREVIRELAHLILEGPEIDSDRLKAIVNALKTRLPVRGRELFHPLRLALAGRAGEGELDRVILLLDSAARIPFPVRVKNARQRMLEFCSALN